MIDKRRNQVSREGKVVLETAQQVPGRAARARPAYAPNRSLRNEPSRGSQALEQQQQEPRELWVTLLLRDSAYPPA